MRSSGSTPSPSAEPGIVLWLALAREDHPKACTGRRLLHRGLVREIHPGHLPGGRPILLDPHSETPLSSADRPRARAAGVIGVDCSWNRLGARGRYPAGTDALGRSPRRMLPFLLAGNPQHYGRLGELNTAEALGAALIVLGEEERGRALLEPFPGGTTFATLNSALLERYSGCADPDAVRSAERDFF
jgi:pre-rRNA-processing protein TSR3